jgi:hypothetical protein
MSAIPIQKQVLNKKDYSKVIDINFYQLFNGQNIETTPTFTLDDFFQLYESLFYQIPKEGDINSHRYILQKEANYLGVEINQDNIQALLDEITSLRQELFNTQQIVNSLNTTKA